MKSSYLAGISNSSGSLKAILLTSLSSVDNGFNMLYDGITDLASNEVHYMGRRYLFFKAGIVYFVGEAFCLIMER